METDQDPNARDNLTLLSSVFSYLLLLPSLFLLSPFSLFFHFILFFLSNSLFLHFHLILFPISFIISIPSFCFNPLYKPQTSNKDLALLDLRKSRSIVSHFNHHLYFYIRSLHCSGSTPVIMSRNEIILAKSQFQLEEQF